MDTLPNTIEECHQLIKLLLNTLSDVSKRIEALEIENRDLKERLNSNSSNSSLPPSKDFKKKKNRNHRPSSGKSSGGQPGHKGHHRELLPPDKVDVTQHCLLPPSCLCGGKINCSDDVVRHQVHELPVLKLHVTEYQLQKGCCENCHRKQIASLPEGITWGITGPRLTSFMSELVSKYGLSRREQKGFLSEHFNFNISLGTVFNKQKVVNTVLTSPVLELLELVKQSPSVHADETGHKRDGKKQWMWGFISSHAAYFSVQASRGKKVLRAMLGDFKNVVISDRYASYNYFANEQRQICWAHLKRDFTRLSEKDDKIIARLGKNLLENESLLFKIWHEFKGKRLSRVELLYKTQPVRCRIGELLEKGTYTDPILKASRFCKNLLERFNSLWTFLETEDVEPTNNHAERSLRPLVIWRKKYFGTRSDYGSEYVARSASIHMTCKLQGKNSFNLLNGLMQNFFAKRQVTSFC